MISTTRTLAGVAYVAVVGAVALALALAGHADLWPGWLGFASVGGIGTAIKGQLSEVARTVGVQHLENGTNLAGLESYTHESIDAVKKDLIDIKGALVFAGLMPQSQMASSPLPPPLAEPPPLPPTTTPTSS